MGDVLGEAKAGLKQVALMFTHSQGIALVFSDCTKRMIDRCSLERVTQSKACVRCGLIGWLSRVLPNAPPTSVKLIAA